MNERNDDISNVLVSSMDQIKDRIDEHGESKIIMICICGEKEDPKMHFINMQGMH